MENALGIHVRKTLGSRDGFRDLMGSRSERARVFWVGIKLAEREGFEPPVRFPVHLISRKQWSAQQLAIVDLAGKQKILLDSIDTWLFTQPSLVNSRKRSVIPVVLQRQALKALLKRVGSQEFQRLLGQT